MNPNNFSSMQEWAKVVTRIAKEKLARGVDPARVHQWLMCQGFGFEGANEITGYEPICSDEE